MYVVGCPQRYKCTNFFIIVVYEQIDLPFLKRIVVLSTDSFFDAD